MDKKRINYRLLLDIFITFFKISPITFGGGFAMIPVLEREMVEKKKWIDGKEIVDVFVVSQSVPGAIAVNSATFLGYRIAGVPGAIVAVLGMVIPTFLIVIILAILLVSFQHNTYVQAALRGIRPVVVALIATAAYKMAKVSLVDRLCTTVAVLCTMILLVFKGLSIIYIILIGAVIGILIEKLKDILKKFGTNKTGID